MSNSDLGNIISVSSMPESKIIGIDQYELRSFAGNVLKWTSFTLVTVSLPTERWWLVDLPLIGRHVFRKSNSVCQSTHIYRELSGLVALSSQGDANLSDSIGALAMYRLSDGAIFAEEVFGMAEPLTLIGQPINQ